MLGWSKCCCIGWRRSPSRTVCVPVCQLLQRGSHAVASQGAAISRQIERLRPVIAKPMVTWIIAGLDLVFSGDAGALCFLCNKRPAWTADEGDVGTSRHHKYELGEIRWQDLQRTSRQASPPVQNPLNLQRDLHRSRNATEPIRFLLVKLP